MEQITGSVARITFRNEQNGYTVLRVQVKGQADPVTVVGSLAGVHEGVNARFSGAWRVDGKYGRQFAAEGYEQIAPETTEGIERYLGSGMIKGIGPAYAKKIVAAFGQDTLDVIEYAPQRLYEVPGLGKGRVEKIIAAWQEQREIRNIMIFLQGQGLSPSYATRIYQAYGDQAVAVVSANPYRLANDIWGVGFKSADRIAQMMGMGRDDPRRIGAGIRYLLREKSDEGHCAYPREGLLAEGAELLGVQGDQVAAQVDALLAREELIAYGEDLCLPSLYHSERGIARELRRLMDAPPRKPALTLESAQAWVDRVEQQSAFSYHGAQREAILKALTSRVMVLTGGPGTGKTTITLGILTALKGQGYKALLCAPTGRAAKRMSETCGEDAVTIHRLLDYQIGSGFRRVNEAEPLDCDALFVDEVSMVDAPLMLNLLKSVPDGAFLLLVGDSDQLPSVGPGNVLKDLLASGEVPAATLTQIYRQALTSRIITNAHRINDGRMPDLSTDPKGDFFFLKAEDAAQGAELIGDLVSRRLPGFFGVDPMQIQVLTPMQRGACGAVKLNELLAQRLNPGQPFLERGGVRFSLLDKVMQLRNNYDKDIFNGDIGRVIHVDRANDALVVRFDNREVTVAHSELDEMVPAYAITIHKSQGSEYPVVVAPIVTEHYVMLQRNLLYTAITRARKGCVLVGSAQAVAMAVNNNAIRARHTHLVDFLRRADEEPLPRP
ncbi:MAG: ATP-dependent RecD-like DNA helicase [Christensenellales bacterium]|jgi:exodeoxyribonuclease V alpha subunit